MVVPVFGTPITERDFPDRNERAKVAYDRREAEGKFLQARRYVDEQKRAYGNGVSTLGLIYNATGVPITLVTSRNFHGRIFAPFPPVIQNGQWGGFLHVKPPVLPEGSGGAVVYRGRTNTNVNCDIMFAWDNPWNKAVYSNHVLTQINRAGHFTGAQVWDEIYRSNNQGTLSTFSYQGNVSFVNIDNGTSPYLRAIFTYGLSATMNHLPKLVSTIGDLDEPIDYSNAPTERHQISDEEINYLNEQGEPIEQPDN